MSRILLADDSPHAQRMGERILREEGFEVVSLTDGNAAMARLADVDPDVILADVFLPGKSGFEICRYVKNEPRFKHVRVVLTAGLLEPFDEDEAKRAGCDAIIKKPFEASRVIGAINPLVVEAQEARGQFVPEAAPEPPPAKPVVEQVVEQVVEPVAVKPVIVEPMIVEPVIVKPMVVKPMVEPEPPQPAEPLEPAKSSEAAPPVSEPVTQHVTQPVTQSAAPQIDPERVRAAVTIALDAAMPAMIQEITERVLIALGH